MLALGWTPLCEVHCNGLIGKFLGGHDRHAHAALLQLFEVWGHDVG